MIINTFARSNPDRPGANTENCLVEENFLMSFTAYSKIVSTSSDVRSDPRYGKKQNLKTATYKKRLSGQLCVTLCALIRQSKDNVFIKRIERLI